MAECVTGDVHVAIERKFFEQTGAVGEHGFLAEREEDSDGLHRMTCGDEFHHFILAVWELAMGEWLLTAREIGG